MDALDRQRIDVVNVLIYLIFQIGCIDTKKYACETDRLEAEA